MAEAGEDIARAARQVMRRVRRATLATSLDGWPYASLVQPAIDLDGAPLLLLSDLAEHTRNLKRDRRASLLFDGTEGLADVLTGPRVTVLGEIAEAEDPTRIERYVARHPSAEVYRGFKDFRCYRLAPQRAHLVAGFGRIHWIEASSLLLPAAASFAAYEAGILAHMNGDHAATIDLYAQKLLGLAGLGWRLTGVDPDGADLRREDDSARLDFATPAGDAAAVRAEFIRLAAAARAA